MATTTQEKHPISATIYYAQGDYGIRRDWHASGVRATLRGHDVDNATPFGSNPTEAVLTLRFGNSERTFCLAELLAEICDLVRD